MGPKIVIISIFCIFYVWVIVATMPYRLAVLDEQRRNDHSEFLLRETRYYQGAYDQVRANTNHDEQEFLNIEEKLADCLWQNRDLVKAIELMADVVARRQAETPDKYNEKLVSAKLKLAGLFRDVSNFPMSESLYKQILEYDQKFLPQDDAKIARDYNNLGLLYYMMATGIEKKVERMDQLQAAKITLERALPLWVKAKGPNSTFECNTLWNLYLVVRDLGLASEADKIKAQAEAIDAKQNRVCRLP